MKTQNFSLHTHTIGFDGRNTIEDMVQTAQRIGFEKLGISNHFIVHPSIKDTKMYSYAVMGGYKNIYSSSFEEAIEKFKPHYEEIDEISQKTGFKIFKGMEVDFFSYDGWREGFEKAREILKPDYVIGAAHFISYQNTLFNSHDLKNADCELQNLLLHKYYQNLRAASESKIFTFLAHLDLMKKAHIGQEEKWIFDELQTVKTISDSKMVVEINTSGFKLPYDEPYPSRRILKMLAEHNVPVIISDDAHDFERLGNNFEKAQQMAFEAGIERFYDPTKNKQAYTLNESLYKTGKKNTDGIRC